MHHPCLCGSNKIFLDCCEPLLKKERTATSPLELMRSRYVAFCLEDIPYLQQTTHPDFRKHFDRESNETWAQEVTFTKLEILSSTTQGQEGTVNFRAHFKLKGKAHIHAEHSTFKKLNGIWYFCEGH